MISAQTFGTLADSALPLLASFGPNNIAITACFRPPNHKIALSKPSLENDRLERAYLGACGADVRRHRRTAPPPIVRNEPSHEREGIVNSQVALLRRSRERELIVCVPIQSHSETVLKPCLVLAAYVGAVTHSNLGRRSLSPAIAPTLGSGSARRLARCLCLPTRTTVTMRLPSAACCSSGHRHL